MVGATCVLVVVSGSVTSTQPVSINDVAIVRATIFNFIEIGLGNIEF